MRIYQVYLTKHRGYFNHTASSFSPRLKLWGLIPAVIQNVDVPDGTEDTTITQAVSQV